MGSENLAETLEGEAALLDAHTASWIVHLPPLLRSAKAEIESLRASLTRVEEERAGCVLVPLEPTRTMIDAGQSKLDDCVDSDYDSDADGNRYPYTSIRSDAPAQIYRAMIATCLSRATSAEGK